MSRTIKFAKPGGPEVVEFIEMEVLAPRPHEVRIEVKAIASTVPNQRGAMIDMSNPYSRLIWDMIAPVLSMPWAKMSPTLPWAKQLVRFQPP
jgi:hypothetical protein